MIKGIKLFLVAGILCLAFSGLSFAQYYELDGKWAVINGPKDYQNLGVTLDAETCDLMITVLGWRDKGEFDFFLQRFNVLRIQNHAHAYVLNVELFEGKAKVVVLDGLQRPFTGWIPVQWLEGNEKGPGIPDSEYYAYRSQFRLPKF